MYLYLIKAQKFYTISATKNLLGHWQLTRHYGRQGCPGRRIHEAFSSRAEMLPRILTLLIYRIRARKYQLVHIDTKFW